MLLDGHHLAVRQSFREKRTVCSRSELRDEDEKFYKTIKNENVLVVDDDSTTMSTLQYVVNTLRLINDENELTLFCLFGK